MPDFRGAMDTEEETGSVPGASAVFGSLPPRRESRVLVDQKALVAQGDGNFIYKRFQMTPVGMILPEDASGEEWEEVGWALKGIENAISWWVGDWALFAMHHWNWTAAMVAEQFEYTPETIEAYASICNGISGLIRNQAVFFSHSRCVAKMTEDMQRAWLTYAEFFIREQRLKVAEFKQDMGAVEMKPTDEQLEWMRHAVNIQTRLSQIKELKPPALLPPGGLPVTVTRGKTKANQAMKLLVGYVEGKKDLAPDEIHQQGRAAIEWIEKLMEASE